MAFSSSVSSRKGTFVRTPHRPADVGHQRPHQRVPRRHRALVDGQALVRNQRGAIHRAHDARAAAGAAGALAVEGQFLGGGRVGNAPRTPGRSVPAGGHPPASAPGSARWGSGGWPAANTAAAGCLNSSVPVPNVLRMPGTPRPLMQGQRRRNHIQRFIHLRLASPCVIRRRV